MNIPDGRTAFYDKFYDRVWRSYRESRKDSLGAYFLKAITAFLKLKPKTYDETAFDHVERILADLQQELEKTESASVSVRYIVIIQVCENNA